jgi:hypothetical protein
LKIDCLHDDPNDDDVDVDVTYNWYIYDVYYESTDLVDGENEASLILTTNWLQSQSYYHQFAVTCEVVGTKGNNKKYTGMAQ